MSKGSLELKEAGASLCMLIHSTILDISLQPFYLHHSDLPWFAGVSGSGLDLDLEDPGQIPAQP